ncbi:MAG: hypothetical protein ACUVTR_00565 [Dehalococcoidia bacterium]
MADAEDNLSMAEKMIASTTKSMIFVERRSRHQDTRPLLAIIILWSVCRQMVMIHVDEHAIDLGIPKVTAANFLVVNGIFSIIGRLAMGAAFDRLRVSTHSLSVWCSKH